MGYRIEKCVAVQLSPIHIPYFGYMVVKGPKGGTYVLDEFSSGLLIKRICSNIIVPNGNTLLSLGRAMNNLEYIKNPINDKTIRKVAKELDACLLQRLECVSKTKLIAYKLDADQVNLIRQTIYKLYSREIQ